LFTNRPSSKILKIEDAEEGLLALIVATMPETLRRNLIDAVDTVYRGRLKSVDSKKNGERHVFDSIHFSYYNRYSKRVSVCLLFFWLS
jgi:hypothetical protein